MKHTLPKIILLTLFLILSAHCFKFSEAFDFTANGFKKVANKFGDKIWHRNNTDS